MTFLSFRRDIKSAQWGDFSRGVEDVQEPTMDDANDRPWLPFQTRCASIRVGLAAPSYF